GKQLGTLHAANRDRHPLGEPLDARPRTARAPGPPVAAGGRAEPPTPPRPPPAPAPATPLPPPALRARRASAAGRAARPPPPPPRRRRRRGCRPAVGRRRRPRHPPSPPGHLPRRLPAAGTASVLDRGRPLRDGRRESSALGAGPPRRIPAAHGAVELLSAVPGGSDRSGQPALLRFDDLDAADGAHRRSEEHTSE